MKTGVELITEIATLSSEIADLSRFINSHPMTRQTSMAYSVRFRKIEEREVFRKELACLPDLTFS